MWVHCHAVALTTALTPCWRGLAATEEPLKVVSGARVREGRNASEYEYEYEYNFYNSCRRAKRGF